jgi:V/A-type H+-transporting ATPase subunit D
MAEALDYNKIAIQEYRRKLAARRASLPTLKSKESALRLVVERLKERCAEEEDRLNALIAQADRYMEFWGEFPYNIFSLKTMVTKPVRIAGVLVPDFDHIEWQAREYSRFNKPGWLATGIDHLRQIAQAAGMREVTRKQLSLLEYARRKTTQKVNLYEKVQIPEYMAAIRQITRYLEDVENLEKAAMKIVKRRLGIASDVDDEPGPAGAAEGSPS